MPNRFVSFMVLASLFALAYGSAAPAQPNAPSQTQRPNVLIIMADDVGYMDFGAMVKRRRRPLTPLLRAALKCRDIILRRNAGHHAPCC